MLRLAFEKELYSNYIYRRDYEYVSDSLPESVLNSKYLNLTISRIYGLEDSIQINSRIENGFRLRFRNDIITGKEI